MNTSRRVVLVDPNPDTRHVLADRLRAQGFVIDEASDGASGAEMALGAPPAAVISDLWMPGVSGVQLSRLLRAEPATAEVPVLLRANVDDARNRFWARRAGASCLVMKGRMGDLVRALEEATKNPPADDAFFFRLAGGAAEVRDRIAEHLDRALFESVVAAEVRALACTTAFDRLFDSLSQLASQLIHYRWLSLTTCTPAYFGIHARPEHGAAAEEESRAVTFAPASAAMVRILDDDASADSASARVSVHDVMLGGVRLGQLAFGIPEGPSHVDAIAPLLARELGAVIRLVLLVEESQRLATTDGLTGLCNRRAFVAAMAGELARSERTASPVSLLLLDLDHFKAINDTHGHGMGDHVLATVAKALRSQARVLDIVARWGGEEFVIALPGTDEAGALSAAERVRSEIAALRIVSEAGQAVPVTASIGLSQHRSGEPLEALVDRADRAMYSAKVGGRNRVCRERNPGISLVPASRAA